MEEAVKKVFTDRISVEVVGETGASLWLHV